MSRGAAACGPAGAAGTDAGADTELGQKLKQKRLLLLLSLNRLLRISTEQHLWKRTHMQTQHSVISIFSSHECHGCPRSSSFTSLKPHSKQWLKVLCCQRLYFLFSGFSPTDQRAFGTILPPSVQYALLQCSPMVGYGYQRHVKVFGINNKLDIIKHILPTNLCITNKIKKSCEI